MSYLDQLRPTYHRAWRNMALRLPVKTRQDWLTGWPWLEMFCHAWATSEPAQRSDIVIKLLADTGSPYRRALDRAGGPHAAMQIVFRDSGRDLPWQLWATAERPDPDIEDVASALVQIAAAVGVRFDR